MPKLMEYLRKLLHRYREQISYLFFGVLTTLVNLFVFWLLSQLLSGSFALEISTWTAWFVSVIFSYLTNRKWVFQSKAKGFRALTKEATSFVGGRIFSGIVDYLIMAVSTKVFHFPPMLMKIISNVVVVVLNYVFSKLFVFGKKQEE